MKKTIQFSHRFVLLVLLVLAGVVISSKWIHNYLVEQNELLAHELAQQVLPAMLSNNEGQIAEVLKSLETHPGVLRVDLVSSEGASIASLGRVGEQLNPVDPQFELASAEAGPYDVQVMAPVTFDSLILANLHLAVSLWPAYFKLMTWVGCLLILPSFLFVLTRQLGIKIRFEKNTKNEDDGGANPDDFDIHAAMTHAMSNAQITVEYQPLYRLSDGGVFGVELVVCWKHPSGQTIHRATAEFAALAKKWGIFLPVDAWVLRAALRKMAFWQKSYGPLVMSFNVSQAQIEDPIFFKSVKKESDDASYPYQLIEFEVSESALLQTSDLLTSLVSQRQGITVDAFGLLIESKQVLTDARVRKIKLDPKLIARMQHDQDIVHLIGDLTKLATDNAILVTAEGVCTRAQCDVLKALGCSLGQGSYFSRPMSDVEFETYLATQLSKQKSIDFRQKHGATSAVSIASGR